MDQPLTDGDSPVQLNLRLPGGEDSGSGGDNDTPQTKYRKCRDVASAGIDRDVQGSENVVMGLLEDLGDAGDENVGVTSKKLPRGVQIRTTTASIKERRQILREVHVENDPNITADGERYQDPPVLEGQSQVGHSDNIGEDNGDPFDFPPRDDDEGVAGSNDPDRSNDLQFGMDNEGLSSNRTNSQPRDRHFVQTTITPFFTKVQMASQQKPQASGSIQKRSRNKDRRSSTDTTGSRSTVSSSSDDSVTIPNWVKNAYSVLNPAGELGGEIASEDAMQYDPMAETDIVEHFIGQETLDLLELNLASKEYWDRDIDHYLVDEFAKEVMINPKLPNQTTSDVLSEDDSLVRELVAPCFTKYTATSPSPEWAIRYPDQPDLLPSDEYVLCSITMSASPLEFALVPKELKCKVEDIERELADFDMNCTKYVEKWHPGDPCYINRESWYTRARVEMVGEHDVYVLMVDIGQTAYVNKKLVKPLPIELAQLAPSAYMCAIKGVDSRELYLATQRRFLDVIQAHEFVAVRSQGRNRWNNLLFVDLFDSRLRKNLSEEFQQKKKIKR